MVSAYCFELTSPSRTAQTKLEAEIVSPAPLPSPELYEQEYTYWPWRHLIARPKTTWRQVLYKVEVS